MAEVKHNIGGQAVIEGVMMRNKSHVAIAVRQAEGGISVQKKRIIYLQGLFLNRGSGYST